jgi:transposase-like protein
MSGHISRDNIIVVETRRRWTDDERRQAVEETQHLPVSAVARKHGMAKSLLFRWRKEAGLTGKRRQTDDPGGSRCVAGFAPVQIATVHRKALTSSVPSVKFSGNLSSPPTSVSASVPASVAHEAGSIEIELVGGIKLRVSGTVRPEALRQVIAALTN